jgi:hypothetical protein
MWEPWHLTTQTLWASIACYRDHFTFLPYYLEVLKNLCTNGERSTKCVRKFSHKHNWNSVLDHKQSCRVCSTVPQRHCFPTVFMVFKGRISCAIKFTMTFFLLHNNFISDAMIHKNCAHYRIIIYSFKNSHVFISYNSIIATIKSDWEHTIV